MLFGFQRNIVFIIFCRFAVGIRINAEDGEVATDKHDTTEAQWIIGKNRFGRLGRIQFRWTAELTKYEEEQNYPVNKS